MDAYLKVYRSGGEVLVAACDREVLGGVYSEGSLRFEVGRSFYCGELVCLEELSRALSVASIANLAGEKVVGLAVSLVYVDEENVRCIGGLKHAQFVSL
ncbi:MAG: DUF424 family protein [Candidatus Altiarchaeota archaeon]|nr:DUF424 family protein [Candidatus Altiarchaeota archaeon]